MSVEVIGAILGGIFAGSFALLAFGGDSVIELISGIAVLKFLRKGSQTGDFEAESERTERITSLLLFSLIPVIGAGAFYSYFSGVRAEASPLGIAVSVGAIIVMPYLWYQKRKIGSETGTSVLTIDALESITCIFMAIALLGGLLAEYFFGLWWVDYLATAIILAFVAKEAIESYRELHNEAEIE
jgi:divalent metal cation (Fe/Co/Zn/Cd) transporter